MVGGRGPHLLAAEQGVRRGLPLLPRAGSASPGDRPRLGGRAARGAARAAGRQAWAAGSAVRAAGQRRHSHRRDRYLADLYETAIANGAPALSTANWIVNEVAPTGKLIDPAYLAELMKLLHGGNITRDQARATYFESVETGRSPSDIVAEHGFAQLSDETALLAEVEAVMEANPRAVEDYRAGKKQALGALMEELIKRAPQANRKIASDLLRRLLG